MIYIHIVRIKQFHLECDTNVDDIFTIKLSHKHYILRPHIHIRGKQNYPISFSVFALSQNSSGKFRTTRQSRIFINMIVGQANAHFPKGRVPRTVTLINVKKPNRHWPQLTPNKGVTQKRG